MEEERARILNEARAQARRELDGVVGELAAVRAQVRRPDLTRERLNELRQRTRRLEERVAPVAPPSPRPERLREEETAAGPLAVGDTVRVLALGQSAEVLELSPDSSEAEVQMGPMRLRVGVGDLQRLRRREPAEDELGRSVVVLRADDRRPVSHQLDMRGWRVEDALEELESYLNDAALSGMPWVRIVHGKGTGALRAAVREHLAHHPLVQSSAPAPPPEGGDGVTIVRLSA
jgi:DNA mismatch repair protein MutS2